MLRAHSIQFLFSFLAAFAFALTTAQNVEARACPANWVFGPDGQLPGVDGWVTAQTVFDPDGDGPARPQLVVCGSFYLYGGQGNGKFATWDGTNWLMRSNAPSANTFAQFGGKLVCGGDGGVTTWDGSQFKAMGGYFNGGVDALFVYNEELIAAGTFNAVGGVPIARIARWDGTTWQQLGGGIAGASGVHSLAVFNGKLIAGGNFTSAGGVTAASIAQWDGTTWQPVGGGITPTTGTYRGVYSLANFGPDLIVGGVFSKAGALSVKNIARWDGQAWNAMGSGTTGRVGSDPVVLAMRVFNGKLYASGEFSGMNGVPVRSLASWNGTTWSGVGDSPQSWGDYPDQLPDITSLTEYDGKLVVGGSFYSAQGLPAVNIAAWNISTWEILGSGLSSPTAVTPNVYSFASYGDELVATGIFATADRSVANNIAAWNGVNWRAFGGGASGPVYTAIQYQGNLIAGGQFSAIGGVSAACIGKWNGTAWSAMGSGLTAPANTTAYAYTLGTFNGDLIVGGNFTKAGVTTVNYIARWDGTSWHPMGAGFNGAVYSLTVFNGEMVAAGYFTKSDTITVNRVARWDGTSWQPFGSGLNNTVNSVTVFRGELVVGGTFVASADGVSGRGAARWDGSVWRPLGTGISATSGTPSVNAILVYNDRLIVAGAFTSPWKNIASWNGSAWTVPFYGTFDNTITSLGVFRGEMQIGGKFIYVDYSQSCYRTRWSNDLVPWIGIQPHPFDAIEHETVTLSATPATAYGPLNYQWKRNGVAITSGPAGASPGGGLVSGASGTFSYPTRGDAAKLTIESCRPSDSGDYTLVITSDCGSDISRPATVTVTAECTADLNGDALVDDSDFSIFVVAYNILDCAEPSMPPSCPADLNGDGLVDDTDFVIFLAAYNVFVCP